MSLRLRLILAFVAFSVVPLAAITWYAYSGSVRALRDAAEQESDLLAGELSQRMQLITAQLRERVEHLMDMDPEMSEVAAPRSPQSPPAGRAANAQAEAAPAAAGVVDSASPAATAATAALAAQVADRLGDAAMLLNNVELRGLVRLPASRGQVLGRGTTGGTRGNSGRRGQGGGSGVPPPVAACRAGRAS